MPLTIKEPDSSGVLTKKTTVPTLVRKGDPKSAPRPENSVLVDRKISDQKPNQFSVSTDDLIASRHYPWTSAGREAVVQARQKRDNIREFLQRKQNSVFARTPDTIPVTVASPLDDPSGKYKAKGPFYSVRDKLVSIDPYMTNITSLYGDSAGKAFNHFSDAKILPMSTWLDYKQNLIITPYFESQSKLLDRLSAARSKSDLQELQAVKQELLENDAKQKLQMTAANWYKLPGVQGSFWRDTENKSTAESINDSLDHEGAGHAATPDVAIDDYLRLLRAVTYGSPLDPNSIANYDLLSLLAKAFLPNSYYATISPNSMTATATGLGEAPGALARIMRTAEGQFFAKHGRNPDNSNPQELKEALQLAYANALVSTGKDDESEAARLGRATIGGSSQEKALTAFDILSLPVGGKSMLHYLNAFKRGKQLLQKLDPLKYNDPNYDWTQNPSYWPTWAEVVQNNNAPVQQIKMANINGLVKAASVIQKASGKIMKVQVSDMQYAKASARLRCTWPATVYMPDCEKYRNIINGSSKSAKAKLAQKFWLNLPANVKFRECNLEII